MTTEIDRREFLIATAAVGGGMALSLYLPEARAAEEIVGGRVNSRPWLSPADGGIEVNPWIVIGPDDRVLIRDVAPSDTRQDLTARCRNHRMARCACHSLLPSHDGDQSGAGSKVFPP